MIRGVGFSGGTRFLEGLACFFKKRSISRLGKVQRPTLLSLYLTAGHCRLVPPAIVVHRTVVRVESVRHELPRPRQLRLGNAFPLAIPDCARPRRGFIHRLPYSSFAPGHEHHHSGLPVEFQILTHLDHGLCSQVRGRTFSFSFLNSPRTLTPMLI